MEQTLYQLPDGWEWQQLADVVVKTENVSPLKHADQLWTYIDISSVDRSRFTITDPKEVLGKDAPSRAKKHVQLNDVIFATTRPGLKNIALIQNEYSSPVVSTGFCILRVNNKVLPTYLFYFVITDFIQAQIESYISGASYPAITDRNLKKALIPIPSIEEQKRIVEKLDALLTRIDTAIEHLQGSVVLADQLFSSSLSRVFNPLESTASLDGQYILPEGWDWQAVKELSKKIQYGHTTKAAEKGNAQFLRITDIQDNNIDWSGVPFVELSEKDLAKYALAENDLVFARSGATAGKSILIKEPPNNAIFASYLIRIVPNTKIIQPEYLGLFFRSPTYWNTVKASAAGAAQPNINGTKLSEFQIPIPKLEIQKRIVSELESISVRVTDLKQLLNDKINYLNLAKSSILDSAFKGEL